MIDDSKVFCKSNARHCLSWQQGRQTLTLTGDTLGSQLPFFSGNPTASELSVSFWVVEWGEDFS